MNINNYIVIKYKNNQLNKQKNATESYTTEMTLFTQYNVTGFINFNVIGIISKQRWNSQVSFKWRIFISNEINQFPCLINPQLKTQS